VKNMKNPTPSASFISLCNTCTLQNYCGMDEGISLCANYILNQQPPVLGATRRPLPGRRDLICPCLEERLSLALEEGANIYGDDNWTKGMEPCIILNHIRKHLNEYSAGESATEPTTDHLGHILANLMFLIHFESNCTCHKTRALQKERYQAWLTKTTSTPQK
jgi:hypothetical protein